MSVTEIFEIAGAIMLSLGGAGGLLYGLSGLLGNILIEREKVKLDNLRSDYQLEVEKNKSLFLRFSESQFTIYNNIWVALCDLEKSTNDLWKTAINREVKHFAVNLQKTKYEVRKGALVIEEDHYNQLMNLFDEFDNFKFGKYKLLELTRDRDRLQNINENQIREVVNNTGAIRERLIQLLDKVKVSLSSKIKGDI